MKNKIKKLVSSSVILSPILASAESAKSLGTVLDNVKELLAKIIPIIMVIATIVFLWGVVRFITSAQDAEKRKEARDLIIYGLIGLFVMVAVWGLVAIIQQFFGIPGSGGAIPTGPGI